MFYLVYLPSLIVVYCSLDVNNCNLEYAKVGRDLDEDYKVMGCREFNKLVVESHLGKE